MSLQIRIVLLWLSCLSFSADAQNNPFRKVGNDLPYPAIDACTDKNGQLYAVCASTDSIMAYTFLSTPKTWKLTGAFKVKNFNFQYSSRQEARCFFLDTTMYILIVKSERDSTHMFKQSTSGFQKIASLFYTGNISNEFYRNIGNIEKRDENEVFILGQFTDVFDGVNTIPATGVVRFDGKNFSAVGMSAYYSDISSSFRRNDTIFYVRSNEQRIYAYNINSNTESVYFTLPEEHYVTSMSGSPGALYYSTNKSTVYTLSKNVLVDSFTNLVNFRPGVGYAGDLFYVHNRLLYKLDVLFGRQELLIKRGNSMKPVRTPSFVVGDQYIGTWAQRATKFLKGPGQDVYMVSAVQREFNGQRYNMVQFNPDSLTEFGFDTIYLQTFGDLDKNGVLSMGDDKPFIGLYLNDGTPFATFEGDLLTKLVLPDYQSYKISSIYDYYAPSCFQMLQALLTRPITCFPAKQAIHWYLPWKREAPALCRRYGLQAGQGHV